MAIVLRFREAGVFLRERLRGAFSPFEGGKVPPQKLFLVIVCVAR